MTYSESDTRAKFIDPMLKNSWRTEDYIIREHYFTDGKKLLGNKRRHRCFADYILRSNGINLAIVEAKSLDKEPTEWLEQVKQYGNKLQIRFVYSTNGEKSSQWFWFRPLCGIKTTLNFFGKFRRLTIFMNCLSWTTFTKNKLNDIASFTKN